MQEISLAPCPGQVCSGTCSICECDLFLEVLLADKTGGSAMAEGLAMPDIRQLTLPYARGLSSEIIL